MAGRMISCVRRLSVILVAFSPLCFVCCNITDTSDGDIDPLNGSVLFWIGESYPELNTVEDPSPMLFMTTEKVYPCCNYSIGSMLVKDDSSIFVELLGVNKPDICLTAIGPASSRSKIALAPGNYSLSFSLDNLIDEYFVTVTDSSISVDGNGSFTAPTKPLVWRYPPRTFAYRCGTTPETSWICSEFLDSLLVTGLFEEYQFPDSGFVPYPESTEGYYYNMPVVYLRYQKEADFESAGSILERYAKTTTIHYTGVGLSLINWRNKRYYSWLLEEK